MTESFKLPFTPLRLAPTEAYPHRETLGYPLLPVELRHGRHHARVMGLIDSGEEIAVETKSRRRKGVIHEPGKSDQAALVKGDVKRLFREACTQRPADMPYLIFIDLNVLPTPGVPMDKKPWLEDIREIIANLKDVSPESPEPFNAWALTNFSYYYAGNAEDAPNEEYVLVVSPYPEVPTKDPKSLGEVWESLQRYSHIPMEV